MFNPWQLTDLTSLIIVDPRPTIHGYNNSNTVTTLKFPRAHGESKGSTNPVESCRIAFEPKKHHLVKQEVKYCIQCHSIYRSG